MSGGHTRGAGDASPGRAHPLLGVLLGLLPVLLAVGIVAGVPGTAPKTARDPGREWTLDGRSFGPVRFGALVAELTSEGIDLREDALCDGSATVPSAPADTYLTVRDGRVLNALVKNPGVAVVGDASVGRPWSAVRADFSDAHRVVEAPGEAWIASAEGGGVLAFFVDQGVVIAIRGAPDPELALETVSCD